MWAKQEKYTYSWYDWLLLYTSSRKIVYNQKRASRSNYAMFAQYKLVCRSHNNLLSEEVVIFIKKPLDQLTQLLLTLSRQINCHLLNFLCASIFKVLHCGSKLEKCCRDVKQLGSGWDAELLGVSPGSKLFAYGTLIVLCSVRFKSNLSVKDQCCQSRGDLLIV